MVELQSCASLVNASSALCGIEQEVKGESAVKVIAEISAELKREREKNAELLERISVLEARIQELNKESILKHGQRSSSLSRQRSLKNLKRHRTGPIHEGKENRNVTNDELKQNSQCIPQKDVCAEYQLVQWMSMDETQFWHMDKMKDDDFATECDDTDDSDEEEYYEEADTNIYHKSRETCVNGNHLHQDGVDEGMMLQFFGRSLAEATQGKTLEKKEAKNIGCQKTTADDPVLKNEAGLGNVSYVRKPPKVAFCPKEVKRIIQSETLLTKDAQSHTIRKIIVFASLGIRHGCDDMFELDFNHFSILRKGEPYVSPKDPGEHVLYENPGIRRKIFYPNRQIPTLCPVQILEEEKAMRPSDPTCPSCLFLCIKYGGRTRNVPQNEYVRQRMGRNKLKSFGPVMCRMAMLVHIRSGSFFFKALGITLLFMAGYPDDLVQSETKYRNADLLQKYYRTDEDAEGEELFLPHQNTCDAAKPGPEKLTGKTTSVKSKGKRQANSINKPPPFSLKSSNHQSAALNSAPATQFGLMGFPSMQTHALAAFQSKPSQTPAHTPQAVNQVVNSSSTNVSYHNQTPYQMFPPQPANNFMPTIYWSAAPSALIPPGPYACTYGFQSFPRAPNYVAVHPPQPYYSHSSCSSLFPKMEERNGKSNVALEKAASDSDSSSSGTEPREACQSHK